MAGRESGAGVVPVERAELVTQDMELIAELISQLYVTGLVSDVPIRAG